MSRSHIPRDLRERVAVAARHRCGYCLVSEAVVGMPMEIDHLLPESLGGPTEEANLWLACSLCNDHRGNRIAFADPSTGATVRLFNPRHDRWAEHFRWDESGEIVVGITAAGRATVAALKMNRPVRVVARRAWISVGWHPPTDESE